MSGIEVGKPLDWDEMSLAERLVIKNKSEKSFLNFSRIFFELLQGDTFLVNWHHVMIAREIDKVVRGGLRRNIAIAIPPGGTKTELISIHLPAYTNMLVQTGVLKRFRNLNLSFADTLVKRNSRRTRDIISSKEYQELWPCSFGVNQAEEWEIINQRGKVVGQTVSRAMGGQITGGRGGFYGPEYSGSVNLDDPDKPEDMFSQTKRDSQQRKLVNTVRSRRGDKSKEHPTPFLVIQQRLNVDDTIGFCLRRGMGVDFHLIEIPALITEDYINNLPDDIRPLCIESVMSSQSRVVNGVKYWSYWPQMEDIDQLISLWEQDEYTFLSQYQQTPIALSGNLVDTDWFGRYTKLPAIEWLAVYVDTNSGKVTDRNDYTVFSLCAKCVDGNMYILDIRRGKWDPRDLLIQANDLWAEWHAILQWHGNIRYYKIEDKQAGQGLITTMQKDKQIPVDPIQRGTGQDKFIRYNNCQPQLKMGKVFIPQTYDQSGERITHTFFDDNAQAFNTDWVVEFIKESALLTEGILLDKEKGYDDQFDTIMDAIQDMLITSGTEIGVVRRTRR